MINKIRTGIILLTFSATMSAYLSIFPALIAFELTGHSNAGFWAYIVSLPIFALISAFFLVWLTAYAWDRLGDNGQWVTVESNSGQKKKRYIPPTCYTAGERDHELEQWFKEQYE